MRTKKYMMHSAYNFAWLKPKYRQPPSFIKKMTVFVADVREYSLFIKNDISNLANFVIKTRKSDWFTPKEIISSSEGSIVYFDKRVKGIFKKKHIYTIKYIKRSIYGEDEYTWTIVTPQRRNVPRRRLRHVQRNIGQTPMGQ